MTVCYYHGGKSFNSFQELEVLQHDDALAPIVVSTTFQFLSGIRSSPTVDWPPAARPRGSRSFNSFQELEVLQRQQGEESISKSFSFNSFQELEVLQLLSRTLAVRIQPMFQFLSGIRSSPTWPPRAGGRGFPLQFQFLSGIRSSPTRTTGRHRRYDSAGFNSFQELEVLQPVKGIKPVVTYRGFNSFQELEVLQHGFTAKSRSLRSGFNSFQELEVLQPMHRQCGYHRNEKVSIPFRN